MRQLLRSLAFTLVCASATAASAQTSAPSPFLASVDAEAQAAARRQPTRGTRRRAPAYSNAIDIRGLAMVAQNWLAAGSTFQAVLGTSQATEFGGGLSLTQGSYFIDVTARRFAKDGERVFVQNGQVYQLGIPTSVTMTPIDVSAGYRFRPLGRLRPYLGGGYTRLKYEESADFAASGDDVSESFNGFHLVGGGEWRLARFIGIATEAAWTRIGKAIGDAGASQAFGEDDLGGTSVRLKLVIGR